jgi:hypothetical protein
MADLGTFCTTANVQYKAGANASATANVEGYINQYVQEAEGFIMCACRSKFKTNYAALNAEAKELLRLATSNLAAISVIQFDMSGFTSRTEAELMMNVLKTIADECIKLLQDQKTVTYSTA